MDLFPGHKGALTLERPARESVDEYLSDPARPVPYVGSLAFGMRGDYMTEDQRFAATRPDVLVYKSAILDRDVTVFGPISVDLKVSTTGTDSDFVVKLIDVYPNDAGDTNPTGAPGAPMASPPMGGYQQLVRGEPSAASSARASRSPSPSNPANPTGLPSPCPISRIPSAPDTASWCRFRAVGFL